MGKRVEPPQETGAPAYFVQYAALWCIMLAFFVALLTMGRQRSDSYKAGVGYIRDAFGIKGGLGLLPFWRKMTEGRGDKSPAKIEKPRIDKPGDLAGFFKGLLWKEGLSSITILKTEFDDRGFSIYLDTPVQFAPGSAVITPNLQTFLKQLGGVLFNLPDTIVTVMCFVNEQPTEDANLFLASSRFSAVARFLSEEARMDPARLETVGYAYPGYLKGADLAERQQALLFTIHKPKASGREPAAAPPEAGL